MRFAVEGISVYITHLLNSTSSFARILVRSNESAPVDLDLFDESDTWFRRLTLCTPCDNALWSKVEWSCFQSLVSLLLPSRRLQDFNLKCVSLRREKWILDCKVNAFPGSSFHPHPLGCELIFRLQPSPHLWFSFPTSSLTSGGILVSTYINLFSILNIFFSIRRRVLGFRFSISLEGCSNGTSSGNWWNSAD